MSFTANTNGLTDHYTAKPSLNWRHSDAFGKPSVHSSPFSSNACFELREQELVMEAVDGGDVGEDPCNDVLRDSSLCELSAKYLQREREREKKKYVYQNSCNFSPNTHLICLLFMKQECKHRRWNFHVVVYRTNIFIFSNIGLLRVTRSYIWGK